MKAKFGEKVAMATEFFVVSVSAGKEGFDIGVDKILNLDGIPIFFSPK